MTDTDRRTLLKQAGVKLIAASGAALAPIAVWAGETVNLPLGNGKRPLVVYLGKRPLLQITARPPRLDTSFEVFDEGVLTPSHAFLVSYRLPDIPIAIDFEGFCLSVSGHIDGPVTVKHIGAARRQGCARSITRRSTRRTARPSRTTSRRRTGRRTVKRSPLRAAPAPYRMAVKKAATCA